MILIIFSIFIFCVCCISTIFGIGTYVFVYDSGPKDGEIQIRSADNTVLAILKKGETLNITGFTQNPPMRLLGNNVKIDVNVDVKDVSGVIQYDSKFSLQSKKIDISNIEKIKSLSVS